MYKTIKFIAFLVLFTLATTSLADSFRPLTKSDYVRRDTAPAVKTIDWANPKASKLEFSFDGIKGWLRSDGVLRIEGPIQHKGLRCATYQLGIRFGAGKPACTNVKWLTQAKYGPGRKHCNNALLVHAAADSDPKLKKVYARITCAERLIKCTGNCK